MPQDLPQRKSFQIVFGKRLWQGQDGTVSIERGQLVEAREAGGGTIRMRALGAPQAGRDFRVVWLCAEEAWVDGEVDLELVGVPWPIEDVRELQGT